MYNIVINLNLYVYYFIVKINNIQLNFIMLFKIIVKKIFKIDQHLARHFKYNGACLSSPPPFLCSLIITPF